MLQLHCPKYRSNVVVCDWQTINRVKAMKNNQLTTLLIAYAILMGGGWYFISDATKLQTWAIIVSGFMLIWYSWETRLLRIIASDQKDQQIQPLVIYENRRGHYIKNIGNGFALNIQINRVLVGGSEDLEIIFPETISVLAPESEVLVKGKFRVNGEELSDFDGAAQLSTKFSNQTSIVSINYSNIQYKQYLTEERIAPGKMEILRVQKLN